MTNKKTLLFTLIILTIFIATSILAIIAAKKITATDNNSSAANTPDFFMTNAIYTRFNSEGNISNRIKTDKITHQTLNDTYLFDNPKITVYNPKEQPWYITSKKGKSEKGKSKVYLWGNVKLIQKYGINNPDFDIATDSMTIYPDRKFAETEKPIKIIQSSNIIDAVGAEMNLKDSSIKLLSKIKGSYVIE